MEINFFLNVLSIHQAPLIRKLSYIYDVKVFYEESLSNQRIQLGWYEPDFGNARIFNLNDTKPKDILKGISSNTINIFSGIKTYPKIHRILDLTIKTDSRNYIQMETINTIGWKGILRKVKYRLLSIKYNSRLSGILSQGGKNQLEKLGFNNVHEFAYFLDDPHVLSNNYNSRTKFIYLGALSERKQILTLLSSLPDESNLILDIYGSEEDVKLESILNIIDKYENINYKGILKNDTVSNTLKEYDFLILPSKSEGWGAVVAEALLCGVGVVVTDVAGITNYIRDKFTQHVHIVDFSNPNIQIELLNSLQPLKPSDRIILHKEAYCLSSEYGVELLTRYIR